LENRKKESAVAAPKKSVADFFIREILADIVGKTKKRQLRHLSYRIMKTYDAIGRKPQCVFGARRVI
jgi:hypothetical protein